MSIYSVPAVRNKLLLAVALACGSTRFVSAGELQITPSVKASGYYYDSKTEQRSSEATEAIAVVPKLRTLYNGRHATASFVIENTQVEQRSDLPNTDKSFTEFNYNSSIQLIENSLTLSINGDQNYRALQGSDTIVTDKILSSGELTKTRSDSAQLNFVIPNPKVIGASIQTGYSATSSDNTLLTTGRGLNSDTLFASAQIYQGKAFKGLTFLFASQYFNTKRENTQDYSSTLSNGRIGLEIADNISFVILGSDNDYGLDESGFSGPQQNLDTTSYGAGFSWQPHAENSIEITFNRLDEGDRTTDFIGLDTRWAFSERTAVQFTYGKRFYGDAYTFNLDYRLKSVSASASYNEDVTSYSRLIFEQGPSALFVCAIGSISFAECFQLPSSDYTLQAGEEFRSLSSFTTDVTDETLFRKSGQLSLGYDKRKLKASLSITANTTEYLETAQEQRTHSAGLSISYRLNRRNTLGFTTRYSSIDYSDSERIDDVLSVSANFNRKLSRQLSMDVSARYVDRETENINRDLSDSRLTVSVNYQF